MLQGLAAVRALRAILLFQRVPALEYRPAFVAAEVAPAAPSACNHYKRPLFAEGTDDLLPFLHLPHLHAMLRAAPALYWKKCDDPVRPFYNDQAR